MTALDVAAWDSLAASMRCCRACPELARSRTSVVVGVAPPGAELLLVGEAPGAQEDVLGLPFVGQAGQLLDALLAEAGVPRSRVAVANVLKCRPPGNRKPRAGEVGSCRPWLSAQLALVEPRLVVALGSTAAEWFLGRPLRLADVRGTVREVAGVRVLPTYHPSAAIRFGPRGGPLASLRADLALAASLL